MPSLASFRSTHPARTIRVAGQDWQVLRSGAGKPAVLVLPGGAGLAEAEYQVVSALEPHVEVLAVSYPAVHSLDALLEGLSAVLNAEGLPGVVVWGSSFGGMVAQAFARSAPDRVSALILGHTSVPDPRRARRAAGQLRLLSGLPGPVVRMLSRLAFARLLRTLPPDERLAWRDFLEREFLPDAKPRMVALSALAADFYGRILTPWTGRTLLLEAPGDDLYGAMASRLRDLYPAAAVHAARSSGHVSDVARVAEEADAVLRFFDVP